MPSSSASSWLRAAGLVIACLGALAGAVAAGTLLGWFRRAGYGQIPLFVTTMVATILVPIGLTSWIIGVALRPRAGERSERGRSSVDADKRARKAGGRA